MDATPHSQCFRIVRFLLALGLAAGVAAKSFTAVEGGSPAPHVGQPLSQRGTLIVGGANDTYPYGYIGPDGGWIGFSGDVMEAVARVMNLSIKRVGLSSREVQDRFRDGEFDFLQSLSQTTDRDRYADFSVPFLTLQGAIFVRKHGSPVKQIEDLAGKRFALVGANSIGAQFLHDHGIMVETVLVSSTEDGLRRVESGDCAATFVSQLTALSVIEHSGLHNVAMLGLPFPDYDIRHCFAVHKGDALLLARLNEGLAILHRNGEFDQIYNRWFGHIVSPFISRQQVVRGATAALVVGLLAALWALQHQRMLRRRISGQASELALQKELLQALYDNVPMAMCVLKADPSGYLILSINRQAEKYFGLPAAEATGRVLADFSPASEWIVHLAELLQRGLASPSFLREERRLNSVNKRLIYTLVPMTPGSDGHARLCVLAEDVTERRNLDDEIAQSRKLRAVGELVGGIAHEFNNLLTPIMLKVGQIQLDWSHDPNLIAETRLIAEAVQRSSELTQRLLTFGRKTDHRAEAVHLSAVVSNCFSLLRLTMDRRILWEQAVPSDLPPIHFSATDLNQIILNLVINARDTLLEKLAAHRGEWTPVIRVEAKFHPADTINRLDGTPSLRQISGWQQLTIRDNGMGMTPDVRERIFEPFFTTKPVGKGTGLGLATVWHIVTEVSGRIEVESTPGLGTAFHVYLPMLPAPDQVAVPTRAALPATPSVRIFMADDDPLVSNAVTAALQRAGHTVAHRPDGAVAWQYLQDHLAEYDLLLLDVNMPGLDGIELAQRLRSDGRYQGRIIITSGRLGSDDLDLITAARVDCVLNKPFAIAELLEAVRTSLANPAKP